MPIIGTNVGALNSSFFATRNQEALQKSIKRLASGSRLVNPSDDAAGVAVSGKLDAAIQRLSAASEGSQNVISLGQTTDGFLGTVQSQLTRMSELAQRATDGTLGASERSVINQEFQSLKNQIDSVTSNASFNGTSLFANDTITTAVGANGETDSFKLEALDTNSLGVNAEDISTTNGAANAIQNINGAIDRVTSRRATVNTDISKFQFHINNIGTERINTEAANSRIRDLNVADETTNLAKNNILFRASIAMQVQANASQNSVLGLLQ